MKSVAYPIILEKEADGYFVTVPDIDRYTQGGRYSGRYGNGM